MPLSTDPDVKSGLERMRELHNVVSQLHSGVKSHFWTELAEHITGAGHIAIFGIAHGAAPVVPSASDLKSKKGATAKTVHLSATDKLGHLFDKTKVLISSQDAVLRSSDKVGAVAKIKALLKKAIEEIHHWESGTWKAGYLPLELKNEMKLAQHWIDAHH